MYHMSDCLSAEQLRLKYDHKELKDRVAEAEQKVQDNLSGQREDRAAFRTLQSRVGKLELGEQRLQQQTAGMAEALEDMIRRKSPSVLWQLSQEAVRAPLSLCVQTVEFERLRASHSDLDSALKHVGCTILRCAHVRISWLMSNKVLSRHKQCRSMCHTLYGGFEPHGFVYGHAGFNLYTLLRHATR